MKKKIQLLPSGIPIVDKTWGGFYRGGTYLLVGPRKSGKTLLGLQFAMEAANQNETCLFFTSMRPKDLMIHAASIDFDLQHFMNQNIIIVVRIATPAEAEESDNPDYILTEYLNDIVSVVEQYNPSKLVFDELTPFISFENVDLLHNAYSDTIEKIEELGTTSLLLLGQPVTHEARLVTDTILGSSTGLINLNKKNPESARVEGGTISIYPNIGHTEGEFSAGYSVEPYKGIVDDYNKEKTIKSRPRKYKPLDQFKESEEKIISPNLYPLSELKLIINNQIALYRSTGQTFELISLKLDSEAERKRLITYNQLQSAVQLAISRKDKLCLIEDKIVIMVPKSDKRSVSTIASKIMYNLPGNESGIGEKVLSYISLYNLTVNDKIRNADEILDSLSSGNSVYND